MRSVAVALSLMLSVVGLGQAPNAAPAGRPGVRVVTRTAKDGARTTVTEPVRVLKGGRTSGTTVRVARPKALWAPMQERASRPAASAAQGTTVASESFGSATVGGTPSTKTLTFSTAGYTGTGVTIAVVQGTEFSASGLSCQGSQCSVLVSFKPLYPGVLRDAITVTDSNGNVLDKTFLYGTGVAPLFAYDGGQETIYEGFVGYPAGVAIGPDGFYYTADPVQNQVTKSAPDLSSNTVLPISNLGLPSGIAVDGAGTLYVLDQTNDVLVSYTAAGVQGTIPTTHLSSPTGLAVDGTGALYIADTMNGRIIEVDNQGNETTLLSGLNAPQGLAVDAAGDLFFADLGNGGEIQELPAGGTQASPVQGTDQGQVQGVAVDASGRVYYTTSTGLGVLNPALGESSFGCNSNPCADGPNGVAVGSDGTVLLTYTADGNLERLDPSTANFILSAPAGGTSQGTLGVVNRGNSPLALSAIGVTGTVFTVDPSSVCDAQTTLATAQSCTVTVDFAPPDAASYQETLTVTSNSLNKAGTTDPFTLYGSGQTKPSTTMLSTSASTVSVGQSVTFTATVDGGGSSSDPTPTGTVQFLDGSTALGSVLLSQGNTTATFSTSTLAQGVHSITAVYSGDTVYAPSTSEPQAETVNTAASSTVLSVSSARVTSGQPETLTATVSGGTATPSGTITFADQNGPLGTAPVSGTGNSATGSLSLTSLSAGSHQITATYGGDANYSTSTSAAQTVTVAAASAQTTTTLTATPSGATYRSPISLVASVQAGGSAIGVGQVIFCDTAAGVCNQVFNLGTAQLASSGSATLKLAAGTIGSHSYQAVFLGNTTNLQSASANVPVTVRGVDLSSTTVSATGSAGNYSLTGTVVGLGSRTVGPTGTVSFNDASNPNSPLLGTATLGGATPGFGVVQPSGSPLSVGTEPYGVATGDLNGDGFADFVVENYSGNSVSVLLGKGDGTFQPQVSYPAGSQPERVLIADFNGDGKPDLVVANTGSGTISILLGNGDGTFQPQVTYRASSPVGLGVLDLNHDGIADIVAGDYYSNTVSVLLGNGDGTFKTAVTYPTGSTPQTLAEGDFNGDGNVDLAVGNEGAGTVGIFLGNGDGTFQAQVTYAVGSQPQGVQVGDFNGDGFEDLAVSNSGGGTVSVLLGKGDGTFQAQVTYAVGSQPVGLVIADFNGDGKQDISVGNTGQTSLNQSILLGNGDGTFQAQTTYPTGNFPYGAAVADFNGDGYPDLAISNFSNGTATVLLSQVTETATASISGVALSGAAGTHNVGASYAGDLNFAGSVSPTIPLTATAPASAPSATTLGINPSAARSGQSVVFSVSVAGTGQTTTPPPTGMVTLKNVAVNPAVVLGSIGLGTSGSGTYSTGSLATGTYSVTASYPGDSNYAPSTSAAQSLTISLGTTTTTLTTSSGTVTAGQPETLTATIQGGGSPAESGSVTFSDQTGVLGSAPLAATSTGGTATLTLSNLAVGSHQITAMYIGDANYAGSTSAAQTVSVSLGVTGTTLTTSAASIPVGQAETLTAAVQGGTSPAESGNITFSDQNGVLGTVVVTATASGSMASLTLTNLAAGTHQITAAYSGDIHYAASTSAAQTVTVSSGTPTATINSRNFQTATVGGTPATVTLTYPAPAAGATARAAVAQGLYFAVASSSCGSTQCTVTVAFTPLYPGLLYDAVTLTDSNGKLLGKTFVYGTGIGPQFAFELGTVTSNTSFNFNPAGVAIGPDGNFYFADPIAQQVTKISRDLSTSTVLPLANIGLTAGIAVDGAGTVYILDQTNDALVSYSVAGVQGTVATTPLSSPTGLAVDGAGTLYLTDTGNSRILKVDIQGRETVIETGLNSVQGIAVDGAGNVFFADQGNGGEIQELVASTAKTQPVQTNLLATDSTQPSVIQAVAVDAADSVYYTTDTSSGLIFANNSGGNSVMVNAGAATGVAVDRNGNIVTTQTVAGSFSIADVSLASLSYETGVGLTAKGSKAVQNTGNSSLAISGAGVSGTGFALDAGNGCAAGTAIQPGHQCPAAVDFTPPGSARYAGTFLATTNSLNKAGSTNVLSLAGIGDALASTATLTASANMVSAGQSVTFTVALASTNATTEPPPGGLVKFLDGSVLLATVSLSGGQAQFTTAALGIGSHSVTAVYGGDTVYSGSTSGAQTVLVSPGATATTLSVSAASISSGQNETLTATIRGSASPAETGSVTFSDANGALGSVTVTATSTGGVATLTLSNLSVGSHQITAAYLGDANYAASTSGAQTVVVTLGATSTSLTVSSPSVLVGGSETLTANVQGGTSPTEGGNVTFSDQNGVLGTIVVTPSASGSTATLTLTSLAAGSHQITARYSGDVHYSASTSAAQAVTVISPATATTLTVSAATLSLGQSETLSAAVQGGTSPAESGTVTFSDQNGVLGSSSVTATSTGSSATLALTTLSVGSHQITARFSNDPTYTASTSAAQTVTVTAGVTSTTLAVSAAAVSFGQSETLTATIVGGTAPVEGGMVTFSDGTGMLGSAAVTGTSTGSSATLILPALSVGVHTITARYSGDANYATSSSAAQTVTVSPGVTSTSLAISAASISAIQSETLTAAVLGGTNPAESGNVIFSDQSGPLGTAPVAATGTGSSATLTLGTLSVGSHTITARYSGDVNYAASSSAARTVTVSLASQTITFPAIPNHVLGDAPFTLNATASSGLAVTYSVVSGGATVSGNTVTLTGTGTVTIQASQAGNGSYAAATAVTQSFQVAPPAPTLSSINPTGGYVGNGATTITLNGSNLIPSDTVVFNGGVSVTPTFVNSNTLTAVLPASFFAAAGTVSVAVHDPVLNVTTAASSFTVSALPGITFSGPGSASSGQQPTLVFQLNPYPTPLAGTVTLTFAPSNGQTDDPAIQFSSGTRVIHFTVPANSTTTPPVQLQTGTVAGVVTVTLVVTANGVNVTPPGVTPVVITILPAVPLATSAAMIRNGGAFTVAVIGFSNTREVAKAIFHFTPVPGATIATPDVTVDVSAEFATWFSSAASAQYGSAFTYTQPFTLDQDSGVVQNVTVTLVNSVGNSISATTP